MTLERAAKTWPSSGSGPWGGSCNSRYFAVRSENEHYLGTLEVTQEVDRIRALTGERRLLEYDAPDV